MTMQRWLACLLTACCLSQGGLDAAGDLVGTADVDGDGVADVVLENPFLRLVLAPAKGGSAISLVAKPSGREMLNPDAARGLGLLGDVFRGAGLDSDTPEVMTVATASAGPTVGKVVLTRRGNAGAAARQTELVKTLEIRADSPVIAVAIEIRMDNGEQRHFPFRYWVQNRLGAEGVATTGWFPDLRGVQSLTYTLAGLGGSQQITVSNPPRPWIAATTEAGPGLVMTVDPQPPTFYAYAKGKVATLEWGFDQVILRRAQSWTTRCTLMPVVGLPRVDGVVGNLAGAVVLDEGSLRGRLLLSGEAGGVDVQMSVRHLPQRAWRNLESRSLTLPALTEGKPASLEFDFGAGAGTFVIRAQLRRGDAILGEIERALTLGESTGRYTLMPLNPDTDQLGPVARDGAIALTPGKPVSVRKILPSDCRLVRGFVHAPVDGRTDTRNSEGGMAEWRGHAGLPAVNYGPIYQSNGLHVTLGSEGFDHLLIRGGWRGRVYVDYPGLLPPSADTPVLVDIPPQPGGFRFTLPRRATPTRLSFFSLEERSEPLADLTLLQVSSGADAPRGGDSALGIGAQMDPDPMIHDRIEAAWGPVYRAHTLAPGTGQPISLAKGEFVHLFTPPQDPSHGIAAVRLACRVSAVEPGALLTVRLHDVLDPSREAMGVDFTVSGPGSYTMLLDVPDQVFLPDEPTWPAPPRLDGPLTPAPVLWLSLASDAAITLDSVAVSLQQMPRQQALVEAGGWRKFLMRGLFSSMSEPRPWMNLEDGKPVRAQLTENPLIARYASSLLEVLRHAEVNRLLLPDDDETRQYHQWLYQNMDRRKPKPAAVVPEVPHAPRWAVLLRENWLLLRKIAQWWMDHRMTPNGLFGGGVNDDTDLFQTWQCFPMIESDPLGDALRDAAAKLGDICWEQHLEEGINRRSTDALHAYEEGVNQLALNAWWFHGDPVHLERVMASARSAMKLMVELPDGRVHFGGPEMGIEQTRKGFAKLGKTEMFSRLFLHPMYELALYNRNPAVTAKMERWGQTWADYQKPGAFVESVDIPSGKPLKLWPHARGPTDEWTAIYQVTGNPRWLEPLIMGMKPGEYWGFTASYGDMPQGAIRWPAPQQEMMATQFGSAGYSGLLLTGNRAGLEKTLEGSLSWFARFRHMHTAAEQKTDRVLTFPATAVLASYLGAGPNRNRWVRFNAVSYEGLRSEDFAALVWINRDDALRVAIYNFRDQPLQGSLRLWRLEHGRYRVRIGPDQDDDGQLDRAAVDQRVELQRFSALPVALPARQVTVVDIEQVERLDDILVRPDLALSGREITIEGQIVRGVAHNIGAAAADAVVAVVDADGRIVVRQSLGMIAAPLDLEPRRISFALEVAGGVKAGQRLVLDPDHAVAEINEANNTVVLPTGETKP